MTLPKIEEIEKELEALRYFAIGGDYEYAKKLIADIKSKNPSEDIEVLHNKLFIVVYGVKLKKEAFEKGEGYEEIGLNGLQQISHGEHKKLLGISEFSRRGGQSKSEAKIKTAKENGKKGGRPPKKGGKNETHINK